MKLLPLIAFLITWNALLPAVSADTDPLRNFSISAIRGAQKLKSVLVGTSWTYHFKGDKYHLRFEPNGNIEKLKWWPDVRWRIIGPSEVLLDKPDGSLMLLRFNDAATSFECFDWTGAPATGTRDGAN